MGRARQVWPYFAFYNQTSYFLTCCSPVLLFFISFKKPFQICRQWEKSADYQTISTVKATCSFVQHNFGKATSQSCFQERNCYDANCECASTTASWSFSESLGLRIFSNDNMCRSACFRIFLERNFRPSCCPLSSCTKYRWFWKKSSAFAATWWWRCCHATNWFWIKVLLVSELEVNGWKQQGHQGCTYLDWCDLVPSLCVYFPFRYVQIILESCFEKFQFHVEQRWWQPVVSLVACSSQLETSSTTTVFLVRPGGMQIFHVPFAMCISAMWAICDLWLMSCQGKGKVVHFSIPCYHPWPFVLTGCIQSILAQTRGC